MTASTYVIDIGSSDIRIGFAGYTQPTVEVATVAPTLAVSRGNSGRSILPPILSQSNSATAPIIDGRIVDSLGLQRLLSENLHVALQRRARTTAGKPYLGELHGVHNTASVQDVLETPENAILCMSSFIPGFLPIYDRTSVRSNPLENLIEWLFFNRGIHRCQLVSPSMMSLYASGIVTGVVIDMGHASCRVCSIADGVSLPQSASTKLMQGGQDITENLGIRLQQIGSRLATPFFLLEQLKREGCFVAKDFKQYLKISKETSVFIKKWELPDGSSIVLNSERFTEPETLFSQRSDMPGFMDEGSRLQHVVGDAIYNAPLDFRKLLLNSMVLCGGGSLLPGVGKRLNTEIKKWYTETVMTGNDSGIANLTSKIFVHPERQWLSFKGASLQGEMSSINSNAWIARSDYDEKGLKAFNISSRLT